MGIVLSSASARGRDTEYVTSESETMNSVSRDQEKNDSVKEDSSDLSNEDEERVKSKEKEMKEFHKELSIKREQRKQILARHRAEKQELEKSLDLERKSRLELSETNKLLRELLLSNNINIPEDLQPSMEDLDIISTVTQMRQEFETLKSSKNKLRRDLADSNGALQKAYTDIADLNSQNIESMKQISALKEVVTVSKTMIALREQQLNELKIKLNEIEKSLADREATMLSTDLRQEYERQLQNIRTLRGLYEERARLAEVTRQSLVRELDEQKLLNQAEINKSKNITEKVKELEDKVDAFIETIENKNSLIRVCQEESLSLRAEMSVINKLFSEVLLGYKTKKDLDKLVHRLEENHGILTQMAERENDVEASTALPKLLLDLVNQVDEGEENKKHEITQNENCSTSENPTHTKDSEPSTSVATTAEEIVQNLPKVWKVLMELLSHQNVTDVNSAEKVTTCYKSVETKSGPVLVPSVSQTYIRLKDLIIEKLGLIKEVNRMKQLNTHLETRLGEQERRLCLVTTELSKTWHVVGRLRRHHHQLHTHEKILKYELQQKRKLLNELKEELEYCREKWDQAREKNSQSEKDWRVLRAEFTSRKAKLGSPSFINSAESGYSDERPSDESSESNDESENVTEPPSSCNKKIRKSFETVLDSSTDLNLAAEREDPASDMLDVADLPLDTQDESHSENTQKSNIYEETEDEVGDIVNESCDSTCEDHQTETSLKTIFQNEVIVDCTKNKDVGNHYLTSSSNLIDPAEILKNVRLQNERLAKKDDKLVHLENNCANLLEKVKNTSQISDQINRSLDHILCRPTSSRENPISDFPEKTTNVSNDMVNILNKVEISNRHDVKSETNRNSNFKTLASSSSNFTKNDCVANNGIPEENIIINLDSEKIQCDQFPKTETECSNDFVIVSNSVVTDVSKLEIIHDNNLSDTEVIEEDNILETVVTNSDDSEPSMSSEIDHEARFAARDLRLKRLEEQTKSLVNKVNKTTSKGVKIHYKLEELHSIYGSESSRAGTPSEENEEKHDEEEKQDDES